jgi:thiamine-monophosphate kinase
MSDSEFALIDRYFHRPARSAVLGVGDDAALIAPTPGCELAISVDMLVSGTHFFADVPPRALGHKTLAVNLSDMAAMGAHPRWALLAGALPGVDAEWLSAFAEGFWSLADKHGVELVGGDTTRGPLNLCVTILGEAPAGEALRRSGAQVGDDIWVSGPLGTAALAVAHKRGRVALPAEALRASESALLWPQPRIALGEALRTVATAAIDLSDGLVGDLGHVLAASRVGGAEIDLAAMPASPALMSLLKGEQRALALECLLAGGDDYELCFSAPPSRRSRVDAIGHGLGLSLARIGVVRATGGLAVLDESGQAMASLPRAYDHFES